MKLKFLVIIILLSIIQLQAQTFTAEVSSNKIGTDEQLQVSFKFEGEEVNSLKDFKPPDFNDFVILSGPNLSTSMQIINGAVSASRTYTYYVQARSTGKFTIGSASITGNKVYKTDPVTIEVVKGTTKPQQKTNGTSGNYDDEIADNLFIRATADKQKVFQGEQVTVTYKLYTRLNIASQMSVSKLPTYQGFWAEEIETPGNISFTNEVVNGKQYKVGILKKAALFPNQTGELTVSPFELVVPVQVQRKRRSNNPFDDFFNDPFFGIGETIEYTAKSNTIKVQSQPLPSEGKPESFTGAVGEFHLVSNIDKTETKTNEPVTLKLEIAGMGNIRLLDPPEIKLPSGFDNYEPKVSEEINRSARIAGKKIVDYLLIPRTVGKKEILPVEFSYFNPEKGTYVTLTTKSYTIDIEQGSISYSSDYTGKEDIRLLGDDIRFIKTSAELEKKSELLIYKPAFWVTFALPFFAFIGLIMWKRRNDNLQGNISRYKFLQAQKIARSRLKLAAQLMEQGKENEFYNELSFALNGYISYKLNIPNSEFSIERAEEELVKKRVDEKLISDLKNLSGKCEYIRFAPKSDSSSGMKNMYDDIASLIINLEREIGRTGND